MIYRALKKSFQKTLLTALTIYSNYISYLLPSRCRFYPSCSQYSYEAIKLHGSLYGIYMTVTRLLRCHPWHEGGHDPVPRLNSNLPKMTEQKLCCAKHGEQATNSHSHT